MSKTKKECIIVFVVLLLCAVIALWVAPAMYRMYKEHQEKVQAEELKEAKVEHPFLDDTVVIQHYKGKDYYVAKKSYDGEYDIQTIDYEHKRVNHPDGKMEYCVQQLRYKEYPYIHKDGTVEFIKEPLMDQGLHDGKKYQPQQLNEIETLRVMNYEEYAAFCEEWEITPKYTDPDLNYIVRSFYTDAYFYSHELCGVQYEGDTAKLYILEEFTDSVASSSAHIYTIPTEQEVENIEAVQVYSEDEYKNILEFGQTSNPYVID